MRPSTIPIAFVLLLLLLAPQLLAQSPAQTQPVNPAFGRWKLLMRNAGISAMHMQLFPDDRLLIYDRTDAGSSNLSLPVDLPCILRPKAHRDCSAHSLIFNPAKRTVQPLSLLTEIWCSSGALLPNGTLLQTGGNEVGDRAIRYLTSCENCTWYEYITGLVYRRWYATNHILPDGRVIVMGGRMQFNYEFVPKFPASDPTYYNLQFLHDTYDLRDAENNLYPFLHLAPDGNMFVFANTKAILLDYLNNKVVKVFPEMPGGISRNYPSTGSSVLLPIQVHGNSTSTGAVKAEVLICGGTERYSFWKAKNGTFLPASASCGKIEITSESPIWTMEEMPMGRVMGDMILLPTGDVLIINGAANGTAGWEFARVPVLSPVLYRTGVITNENQAFEVLNPSPIPRMYHSTAHLLSDGRVIVGGSNPHVLYTFTNVLFPTELSLEVFFPPYLNLGGLKLRRPVITAVEPGDSFDYRAKLSVGFSLKGVSSADVIKYGVSVTMVSPSFNTHSFSMNQRLLVLGVEGLSWGGSGGGFKVEVFSPVSANLAPPGYYMLFVVHRGVPSKGKWVHIGKW